MLSCEEVREKLWPLDRPRGVVEGERAARDHLERCAGCRAFFERDAMISRSLDGHRVDAPAPPEVRARVTESLRHQTESRQGAWRGRRLVKTLPWAAAAALVGLMVGLSRPVPGPEVAYAQDFLSRAVEADAVEDPDVQAASAFFIREFGVPIAPVVLAANPMRRAMICLIDGERAALVEYEMNGHTLAHYRVPLKPGGDPVDRSPTMSEENGVCVYRWSDERFEHALVSDMPEALLLALAEANFTAEAQ